MISAISAHVAAHAIFRARVRSRNRACNRARNRVRSRDSCRAFGTDDEHERRGSVDAEGVVTGARTQNLKKTRELVLIFLESGV